MGLDRQHVISSLYNAALAHEGDDRATFLREACPDDDVRAEIESLLEYEQSAKRFLEGGALSILANTISPNQDTTQTIGRLIGSYEVLSFIGAGGMGLVYRARDTKLGRHVALKILSPQFTADSARSARFDREARLLASLNHPNIGGIYGIEDADGVRALVLELVEGETLADMLRRGPLTVDQALNIARQIAEALKAAHGNGIIHRDLKPANIGVTVGGVVKVLDFGLAKAFLAGSSAAPASPHATITGDAERVRLGTPAYMSPEQARGVGVDRKTDIWAFGCVTYEMLTGRAAFEGDNIVDILASIVAREPRWEALPPLVPSEISRLIKHCLERDTACRLPNITDAIATLDDALQRPSPSPILRHSGPAPVSGSGPGPTDRTTSRRHSVAASQWLGVMGLPLWLLVPLILLAIVSLGFVSSMAFNRTIGLSPRFGTESPGIWFSWGLKFLAAPVIITIVVTMAVRFVRSIRRGLSSRFPTIGRIDQQLSQALRALVESLDLDDPYVLAPAVTILGAMALAVTLWRFADVITAFWYPINELLPEQVAVLRPGSTGRTSYMTILFLLILALAVSMRYAFERRRRAGVNDRAGWPAMGLAVLAVAVLFLAMPYRILFHSKFERIRFQGNQCFIIGENRVELLLHCPTIPPLRNVGVNRDDPALTDRSTPASIYEVPRD
jgi:serine/threonine protein kinase